MRCLIFSDLHLKQEDLDECEDVLNEILDLHRNLSVDLVVNLGDTFDTVRPSNTCLNTFSSFLSNLKADSIHIVAKSHESVGEGNNIIDHFGILNNNLLVYPESYSINNVLFGHFMVQESQMSFREKRSREDFLLYKKVFSGHQHIMQVMDNFIHVGSCRYIKFPERDQGKFFIIYDFKKDEVLKIPVRSIIPMKQIEINNTVSVKDIMDIDPRNKIRLVFKDTSSYKKFLPYFSKFKERFYLFRQALEVGKDEQKKEADTPQVESMFNYLLSWINENVKDEEVKDILLDEVYNGD